MLIYLRPRNFAATTFVNSLQSSLETFLKKELGCTKAMFHKEHIVAVEMPDYQKSDKETAIDEWCNRFRHNEAQWKTLNKFLDKYSFTLSGGE